MAHRHRAVACDVPSERRASRVPAVIAGAVMIPICGLYLWFPNDGDQTLFELYARQMLNGAQLYRDYWDIKQPGIFWFFELGTALGPGVLGPRLLALAAAGVGCWLVWHLTGTWRLHLVVRCASPALVVGSYLLLAHVNGVNQIEGLVNPWMLGLVVLVWPADPGGGTPRSVLRWVLAGGIAGVIGVFKLIYLPVPAVLLVGALVASHGRWPSRAARLGAAVAGALVPLLATVGYFAAEGEFALLKATTLLPLESVEQMDLASGWHRWKDLVVNPIPALALVALVTAVRRRTVVREATFVLTALAAYELSTFQYPGAYRLLMLAAPLGLLACVGADVVWRRVERRPEGRTRRRVAAVAALVVLSLPMGWGPWRLASDAGRIPWGLDVGARNARDFVLIRQPHDLDVVRVRPLIRPGTAIYVFGHPQIYELVDAYQAVPISGWDPDDMPRRVWTERDRELSITRPEWVYVEAKFVPWVERRSPRFAHLLGARYEMVSSSERGIWYHTADVGPRVPNELDRQPQ